MKSDRLPENNQPLVYRTGRGCLTGCISGLHIQLTALLILLTFPANLIHSEGFNYHRLQQMLDICSPGPGQAPQVNLFNPELISSTPKPSHNIIHLLKSITIHQVTQSSLTQLVPLSAKSLATYTFRLLHYYFSESSFFTELLDQGFIHLNDFLPMCLNPSFSAFLLSISFSASL